MSNPESYEDLVELLVPVLQERGLMWNDYTVPGGSYRENMLRTPGQKTAPAGHPSREFSYNKLKEKYGADTEGNITIDKRDPEPVLALEKPEVKEEKEDLVPRVAELKIAEAPAAVEVSA